MGSETKVVPTTTNTQQQVQLPAYLQQAGQSAVDKATQISNTPFPKYNGTLVAPLSANQNTAVGAAPSIAGGEVNNANLNAASGALRGAGALARGSVGTGQGALNGAATLFGQQGAQALSTQGAGADSANADAALASLSGRSAVTNQNVGATALKQANDYNAKSAAPISAADIASYFNPYVASALDPVAAMDQRVSAQNKNAIDQKAAMSGAFGGSRSGLEESQNQTDLQNTLTQLYGQGYNTAYNTALSAAQSQQSAASRAAQTAISASGQSSTNANAALQRLIDAASASGSAATTQSGLATDAQSRLGAAGQNASNLGTTQSALATDALNRLLAPVQGLQSNATTQGTLNNDALNQLLTTGNLDQTQGQNEANAKYQQFQNEALWPQQQLNALLAAAGGVPYGTSTTSNTQGTQVVQSPSMIGQLIGAGASIAGAMSDREAKMDITPASDEDILRRLRSIPTATYRYKNGVREKIGDDGRTRVGPMAQDFGREFLDDPEAKIIPMPEILGVLVGAVKALDARTAEAENDRGDDGDILAEFRKLAA